MNWFKETWFIIKSLFNSKPLDYDKVEVVIMDHYPWNGFSAMSWCGKLLTKRDFVKWTTFNHENIHLKQAQQFDSWLAYYWSYFKYWIKGGIFIHPTSAAYYTIPYEMEAYANEDNADYITNYNPHMLSIYTIKDRKKTYKQHQGKSAWIEYCKSLCK